MSEEQELANKVEEIPTSCKRWEAYLNHLSSINSPDYEEKLSLALYQTKYELANSQSIWTLFYNNLEKKLDLNKPEDLEQLKNLWIERLQSKLCE
ncbi:unnamed protein product [Ambrosiozyma monospora]|uniref:Unnamed protein product n=1 Tax=Ambrosiozyma monospora TaxID=43982 RepID=A0ACB5T227_AMBMO|nr:unnamed protein product [Ambrosiozyma monospora]